MIDTKNNTLRIFDLLGLEEKGEIFLLQEVLHEIRVQIC
jgi:hypothetical protein